jgi:hypothetical protein
VRGVEPDDASAPAITRDRQFVCVAAVLPSPGDRGVEVAHYLRIGNFRDDLAHNIGHRQLRYIALARVHLRRDGQITGFGQAAADIFDVFVDAEDFLHDEHRREVLSLRGHRAVGRNLAVFDGDFDFARGQAVGVSGDRGLRLDRLDGEREAGGERGHDEGPARQIGGGG